MNKEKIRLTLRFVIITVCISLVIVAASFTAGFLIPKSDKALLRSLSSLQQKDSEYLEAKQKNAGAQTQAGNLAKELEQKQKELDEFRASQDNLEKISDSNSALEQERDSLKDEIKQKQKELENLTAAAKAYANKIMTWGSGDYTVGSDIAAGRYTITGAGSIAIASNGKSKVNKLLKSDGEDFTLSEGDLIHIDGNAKIVPQ